ncbi:MAG: type I restriction enzyme S subunit [Colwellia sp.]
MSWPLVKLGDVAELINGDRSSNYPSGDDIVDKGILFLNTKNIIENKINLNQRSYITQDKFASLSRGKLQKKDLIITLRGTLGSCCIFDTEFDTGFINAQMMIIRCNDGVFNKYLHYYLTSFAVNFEFQRANTGSAVPQLTGRQIAELEIPLPPLDEQKRIVAILDKADAIRRKRQQAINLADDFLRSVFLDMFGDPVTNPKGWEVKQVGKVVDCIVPGRDKPKSFTGGMPWITTNDLMHLGSTSISEKSMGLSDEEILAVKAKVIPKGSVLMTCVGNLGVISLAGNDMVMNQQLHAFLASDNIEKEFLMYALSFQKHYMVKMASSTTVPYMNKTVCNSVPVILPPNELQKKFTKVYKKAVSFKEKLLSAAIENGSLFNASSQKAFAGEL